MKSGYVGFDNLKASLSKRGVRDPGALAAFIGKKKYGASKFESYASRGKKMRGVKPR